MAMDNPSPFEPRIPEPYRTTFIDFKFISTQLQALLTESPLTSGAYLDLQNEAKECGLSVSCEIDEEDPTVTAILFNVDDESDAIEPVQRADLAVTVLFDWLGQHGLGDVGFLDVDLRTMINGTKKTESFRVIEHVARFRHLLSLMDRLNADDYKDID